MKTLADAPVPDTRPKHKWYGTELPVLTAEDITEQDIFRYAIVLYKLIHRAEATQLPREWLNVKLANRDIKALRELMDTAIIHRNKRPK